MRRGFRGSAVVTAITRMSVGARLELRPHTGADEDLVLDVSPDVRAGRLDSAAVRRPVAVIIRLEAEGPDCALLGTSRTGPVRRETSLGSALALCESGVYTVVVLGTGTDESLTPSVSR